MKLIRRSTPAPQNSYAAYRPQLRRDFEFSCAYCTILELEAMGVGYQIDHYDPRSNKHVPANEYSNLMYACEHCNSRKSGGVPVPDPSRPDLHLLRPDQDDFDQHAEISGPGLELKDLTPSGRYTIKLIGLNRKTLLRLRQIRRDAEASDAFVQAGLRGLSELRADELPVPWRNQLRELQKTHVGIPPTDNLLVELLVKSKLMKDDPDEDKVMLAERRQYLGEMNKSVGEPVKGRN